MNKKNQNNKLKSLVRERNMSNNFSPMSEEEISIKTNIPIKEIEASLQNAYKALINSGVSINQLKEFSKKEREFDRK